MSGHVVLFGATGFTGRLTAAAMVGRGLRPTLVGRRADAVAELASSLGGLPTAVADATPQGSRVLAELLDPGDVLVTTVGPFARHGRPAVDAAITAQASYVDSTGEPAFLHDVFTADHDRAIDAGVALLPAFGYDYVPGHLAASIALTEAGDEASRVDVGYFVRGGATASGGTLASGAGMLLEPVRVRRDGRLVERRMAQSVRSFLVGSRDRDALLLGGSEPLALQRTFPGVRDVEVWLGWAGSWSRAAQAGSLVLNAAARLPKVGDGLVALGDRFAGRAGGDAPDPQKRSRTWVVAEAADATGRVVATATVEGPEPYAMTAELLASAAAHASLGELAGVGALGPLDAFGVDGLTSLCQGVGLRRVEP